MHDIADLVKNIEELTLSDDAFRILKDFERVIDSLDIYVYENWINGELIVGPVVHRHTVECKFMWEKGHMPDPRGAVRLSDYGCEVTFQEEELLVPRKIRKPEDLRPGTQKGKIDAHPIWVVTIIMPKKLMQDVSQGQDRKNDDLVRNRIDINPSNNADAQSVTQEVAPNPQEPIPTIQGQ